MGLRCRNHLDDDGYSNIRILLQQAWTSTVEVGMTTWHTINIQISNRDISFKLALIVPSRLFCGTNKDTMRWARHYLHPSSSIWRLLQAIICPTIEVPMSHRWAPFIALGKTCKASLTPSNVSIIDYDFNLFCIVVNSQMTRELLHCDKIMGLGDVI